MLQTIEAHNDTPEVESISGQSFDNLFGILTADLSVSLEEMEHSIAQQGQEALDDSN